MLCGLIWKRCAFEVFGAYIENEDGTRIPGLELFGGYAKRRMMDRFNGMFLGSLDDADGKELKILGFKSQFTHFYGDTGVDYAFKRLRGKGLNPDAEGEGVRIKNFIGTYLIGPLLVVNPLFTVYILKLCGIKDPHPAFRGSSYGRVQCTCEGVRRPHKILLNTNDHI